MAADETTHCSDAALQARRPLQYYARSRGETIRDSVRRVLATGAELLIRLSQTLIVGVERPKIDQGTRNMFVNNRVTERRRSGRTGRTHDCFGGARPGMAEVRVIPIDELLVGAGLRSQLDRLAERISQWAARNPVGCTAIERTVRSFIRSEPMKVFCIWIGLAREDQRAACCKCVVGSTRGIADHERTVGNEINGIPGRRSEYAIRWKWAGALSGGDMVQFHDEFGVALLRKRHPKPQSPD